MRGPQWLKQPKFTRVRTTSRADGKSSSVRGIEGRTRNLTVMRAQILGKGTASVVP
jgi:hypothetical protein